MIRRLLSVVMLFGLSVLAGSVEADEKKEQTKKPEVKPRLVPAGAITAQVAEVDGTTLRLRVPQPRKPNYAPRPQGKDKENPDDIEITLADDVKVRVPFKPELDEKGRPKPPPRKDPKDPDRNLPGVRGSTTDLQKGVWVTVTLAQTREKQPKTIATMVLVVDEGGRGEKKK